MVDWNWINIVINATFMLGAFYYGRFDQRRDDRKAAEKRALATAQAILRRDGNRGA